MLPFSKVLKNIRLVVSKQILIATYMYDNILVEKHTDFQSS
jgi:hypothetical protein